jgi:PAS domain S-box-containing protein
MDNSALEIKIQHADLFEYSLDFLFLIDLAGNILEVNRVAIETLGYSKEEILSKNITDIIIEEVVDPNLVRKKELIDIGRISRYNIYVLEKKNGEQIYLESHGIPLRENGEIHTILGIGHEITEMIKTGNRLKEQSENQSWLNTIITLGNESTDLQEFLKRSYDQVLDVVGFDRGGVYLYNPENQHNKLVLHKNVHPDFITAVEDVDISEGLFSKVFDKYKPFYIEDFSEFMEDSKELGVYSAVIVPLRSKDEYVGSMNIGSPIYQVLSQNELELLISIGKQMGIIIQKFESEELLKQSEEKFRNLFENAKDGILLADSNTRKFSTGNKGICEMLGYSLDELKNLSVPDIHPKEELSYILEQFDKQVKGEIDSAKDIPVKRKDGSIFYADINASQIQLGNNTNLIGIFRDITEHKQAEQKLEDRARKLELLNEIIIRGGKAQDIETLLKEILNLSLEMMDFDGGGIYLVNDDKKQANLICHRGLPLDFIETVQTILIDENRYRNIFIDNEPLFSENYPEINPDVFKRWKLLSVASIPLNTKNKVIGALNIASRKRYFFTVEEKEILQSIGSQIGTAIEKIRAEEKLKESEEKFRSLAEQSLLGIGILQDEELKYVNSKLASIFGFAIEELKGMNFQEFLQIVHPEDREKVIKQVQKRKDRTRDTITYYQFRVYINTGELTWVEVFSKIINYQGGRASLLTFLDITDIKSAELELKESEEKFRAISEQSFMNIMVIQDGILKYFNEKLPQRIGYSSEEIKNWAPNEFAKVIHPDDREFVLEQARKKQAGEKDVMINYKYRRVRKDGTIGWVENFSKTINYGGRPADLVVTIDITDRLEAELKLKESEEKFRNIAEQSFMGIVIIQNGKIKYMNKAMSNISGYPLEEMLNWSQKDMLKIVYPQDFEQLSKRFQSNIEGTMGPYSTNAFRIINRNGHLRWLEDYTSSIIYQGALANLISIVDITDKKEAEQLIIEENKRLLELHELRKDLITRVSHELKTPLTSIYGAHQILIKLYMDEIGEEAQKYIEIGHRGALRLKQLIDNLLDTSRLDAKKFELNVQKEDLVELIIDCVKDMNYLATNRQLKMKLDLPNEAHLDIDRLRFRQVLSNLLSNAIKNTPTEGEIFIDLVDTAEYIDIQIRDTGVGLTENEMEKLFEKFGKIERYGMDLGVDIEGSGLGLYISKEIVELHGGQIFVESEGRHKGATFTIRLFKN